MKILMALDYYRPNVSGLTLYVEHLDDAGRQPVLEPLPERFPLRDRSHRPFPPVAEENGRDWAVPLARRGHGFDHVAVVGGVVVSEEGDELSGA